MTAAGLQILISVLKYIFGLKIEAYTGPLAIVYVSEPDTMIIIRDWVHNQWDQE